MSQQIVILAAGKGTRMGVDIPKVLLPLGDKPVISRLLEEVKSVPQETAPVIVVGFKKELVEETLGDEYIYVQQFDQKGTAHAVLSAKPAITAKNIIVLNGDMPFTTKGSLEKVIDLHNSKGSMLTMLPCTLPNFENEYANLISYGRIIRDADLNIIKIQEYKDCTEEQKQITEVNSGSYMFNSEWLWSKLDQIGHTNSQDEFYLTDIVEIAIRDGQQIQAMQVAPKEVYGINTPENLQFAKEILNK